METEIVKMSPKGQLVVPQKIREKAQFDSGDRFVPIAVKDGVLFKRIKLPNVKIAFEKLSKDIEKQFKERSISPKNVKEAIKWSRESS